MLVNVPNLIIDLENAGLSDIEIAIRCGAGKSSVHGWKMGYSRPALDPGLRLVATYFQFCPDKSSELRTLFGLKPRVDEVKTSKRG